MSSAGERSTRKDEKKRGRGGQEGVEERLSSCFKIPPIAYSDVARCVSLKIQRSSISSSQVHIYDRMIDT